MMLPTANPLVTALANGQPQAYADLYDRLGVSLFRVARSMLGSTYEAEDAVQDVFVELVRGRERLIRVLDLDAYVFAMLRNAVRRRVRHEQNERRHLRQLTLVSPAEPNADHSEDVVAAMQLLPAEQREVVALKIDGGLTFAQIAEVLDVSPNTAASRYRYALEKLRRALE